MNTRVIFTPCWSTASFGDPVDSLALEWAALGMQLDLCKESHGRLFALRCVAQTLHGFVKAHFVTLVVITLLIGVSPLVS
jgi:hypothetical protein